MEQWDKNFYITSVAGTCNGSALVVMSKGNRNLAFFFHLSIYIYSCIHNESRNMRVQCGAQIWFLD